MTDEFPMARGSVLRIEDEPGTSIRVWSGALWVTQEGDARDYYLTAGQSLTVERRGTTIATAMHSARISVTAPEGERRTPRLLQLFLSKEIG
ncbi:MAG: DUF2917 domain-containing protein [Betaproteobacteria bacterium]|jgi:hypothetical protein|nr:DUF2917 domain-containing protein [Betaproteobacteria bacterium]